MKKTSIFAGLFLLLIPITVFAQTFEYGDEVIISEAQTGDVYATGGAVIVNADIDGDLVTAGGMVTINATVSGDVIATGGSVVVNGTVGDDLRVAGGDIKVSGTINDHIVAAGGTVMITPEAEVPGEVRAAGGQVMLVGDFANDIHLAGANIVLDGTMRGNVHVTAGSEIDIKDNTYIDGNLTYTHSNELSGLSSYVSGEVIFNKMKRFEPIEIPWVAILFGLAVFEYLAVLLIGLVVILVIKKYTTETAKVSMKHPWISLGYGIVFMVVVPTLISVLFTTIIGIPLALLALFVLILGIAYAHVQFGLTVGYTIFKITEKSKWYAAFGAFALGILIVSLLFLIPIIGWLAYLIGFLLTFGAMIQYDWFTINNLPTFKESKK